MQSSFEQLNLRLDGSDEHDPLVADHALAQQLQSHLEVMDVTLLNAHQIHTEQGSIMVPPVRYQIACSGENECPFTVYVPPSPGPRKVSLRVKFTVTLLKAGWDARPDMAHHKHVMARLGPPKPVPKPKILFHHKKAARIADSGDGCHTVEWKPGESPFVTFTKVLERNADAPQWKETDMSLCITLLAGGKNVSSPNLFDPEACFGCASMSLVDYVPVSGDVDTTPVTCMIRDTRPHSPFPGFYLKLEIQVVPELKVAKAKAFDASSVLGQFTKSEKSADAPPTEVQFKFQTQCSFLPDSFVGIVPEQPTLPCMLLHRLSQLETCHQSACNCIGKVSHVEHDHPNNCTIVRVKTGKNIRWRLSTDCSSRCQFSRMQSNVCFCIFPCKEAAEDDKKERDAEKKLHEEDPQKQIRKQQERYMTYQNLKEKALAASQQPFELDSNELEMVRLRRCFLTTQPLISKILVCLMQREDWFGGEWKRNKKIVTLLGSDQGPWDIYKMMNFLMSGKESYGDESKDIFWLTVTALYPSTSKPSESDKFQNELRSTFQNIFSVRNWWAHIGAQKYDCIKAARAIDFLLKKAQESLNCFDHIELDIIGRFGLDSIDHFEQHSKLRIDDVAYVIFTRTRLQMCELCQDIQRMLPDIEFSKKLDASLVAKGLNATGQFRQGSVVEIKELNAVLKDLVAKSDEDVFNTPQQNGDDCKMIKFCRNRLSHATADTDQTILVLVTLSSVSRVIKFITHLVDLECPPSNARATGKASDLLLQCKSFTDSVIFSQAELLARCNLCDVNLLIGLIFECNQITNAIDQCPFQSLNRHQSESIMRHRGLQLLFEQKIIRTERTPTPNSGLLDSTTSQEEHKTKMSLLHLVAQIPPNKSQSVDQALDWLLCTTKTDISDLKTHLLLQTSGPIVLMNDFAIENKEKYKCGFFSKCRERDDDPGYRYFEQFCTAFKQRQDTTIQLLQKLSEYDDACSNSSEFEAIEKLFLMEPAANKNDLEFWTRRSEHLQKQKDADVHHLFEIAEDIKLLLEKEGQEFSASIDFSVLRRFLKR